MTDFLTQRVSRRTALLLGLAASTSLSAAAIAASITDAAGIAVDVIQAPKTGASDHAL